MESALEDPARPGARAVVLDDSRVSAGAEGGGAGASLAPPLFLRAGEGRGGWGEGESAGGSPSGCFGSGANGSGQESERENDWSWDCPPQPAMPVSFASRWSMGDLSRVGKEGEPSPLLRLAPAPPARQASGSKGERESGGGGPGLAQGGRAGGCDGEGPPRGRARRRYPAGQWKDTDER